MDEFSALNVIALRAVETADGARTFWNDDDRAWASRAAAEVVGAEGTPEAFLARRATLGIEKLGVRKPALPRAVRALRWRPWVGTAAVALAFILGVFLDQIDASRRVNVMAPPVLGLLLWNLGVYVAVAIEYVLRYGDDASAGPLRRAVTRMAGGLSLPRRGEALRGVVLAFVDEWARRSAPLYGMRAARILHLAAAALAVGVIGGVYVRGLVLEYRASWESTFLEPPAVHSILAIAYAPGALITGIGVPDIAAVAAIRSPGGENAARWLHLMAATLAAVVVVPRLLLAFLAGLVERHRAANLPLPLDEPYFQRLLRGYRGGAARVRVIPYSYAPGPAALAGLESVIARAFGGGAAIVVAQPVAYGAEDSSAGLPKVAAGTTFVALFNASATPEREVHGAFMEILARQGASAEAILALVDESGLAARWHGEHARMLDRRAAWMRMSEEVGVPTVFVDLAAPDLVAAEHAIDQAIMVRDR
ncbi:MAG TPA: DUF2868 domain-containing protein [Casimicrobiaceae bacterium]|jgi:hypothetical protein